MVKKLLFTAVFVLSLNIFAQDAEQYELVSINFEGNKAISSSELKTIIYSEETPWFFWKWLNSISSSLGNEPVYFDSSSIEIDLAALNDYYNANGFFTPAFSYSYTIDTSSMEAALTYTIEEGAPSRFNTVKANGIADLLPSIRNSIWENISVDTTERYDQNLMQQKIDESMFSLWNNGYMFARFDSALIYKDTVNYVADITVNYSTFNRYKFDTVIVNVEGPGSDEVDKALIRKLVNINTGEFYDLSKIRRSQSRLFRSNLFNSVVVMGAENDTAGNYVPLLVEGTIGLMNELAPEFIINNQNNDLNLGLGANYIRKNFLGDARNLTLRSSFGIQDFFNTDFGAVFQRFSFRDTVLKGYFEARATIEQPYVFNEPIFGIWDNYLKIDKKETYNISTYGTKFTFEFELPPFTFVNFLSTYYNLEQTNEYYQPTSTRGDSLSKRLISIIGADLGRRTADNLLFPTKGYSASLLIEEANSGPYLISKIAGTEFDGALFFKLLLHTAFYLSLDPRLTSVLAAKLKTGIIQTYLGDYSGLPLNRTFYAGGSNSVRGWRSNELPGRDVKGGIFLIEGSFEHRWRFLESFGTAAFFDWGNTWREGVKGFRIDDLALAVGFGFRYYTQVAPFRLDFGFKLFDPRDSKWLWEKEGIFKNMEFHFGIGEAF